MGLSGAVVTPPSPISEVSSSNPGPYVGKDGSFLPMVGQFTVQNLEKLYVLVFSAHKTIHLDLTCTVLKAR